MSAGNGASNGASGGAGRSASRGASRGTGGGEILSIWMDKPITLTMVLEYISRLEN